MNAQATQRRPISDPKPSRRALRCPLPRDSACSAVKKIRLPLDRTREKSLYPISVISVSSVVIFGIHSFS